MPISFICSCLTKGNKNAKPTDHLCCVTIMTIIATHELKIGIG